jgi:hypothetical protein
MSKRLLEPDMERVRELVPLAFHDLGDDMIMEILKAVARSVSATDPNTLLEARMVDRMFARALKDIVSNELVGLLEEASAAYAQWQGRRIIPVRFRNLLYDFGNRMQLDPEKVLLEFLHDRPGRGREWSRALITSHGLVEMVIEKKLRMNALALSLSLSREVQVLIWLRGFQKFEWSYEANLICREIMTFIWFPPNVADLMSSDDTLHEIIYDRATQLMGYYVGNRAVINIYQPFMLPKGQKNEVVAFYEKRFPVLQDWCAWLVQERRDMVAEKYLPILQAIAALPRQPDDPISLRLYEILGPLNDFIDQEHEPVSQIIKKTKTWLKNFKVEKFRPNEKEATLNTIAAMIMNLYRPDSGIENLVDSVSLDDAMEIIQRLSADRMVPSLKEALFVRLVNRTDININIPAQHPSLIWNLRYRASPFGPVFNTRDKKEIEPEYSDDDEGDGDGDATSWLLDLMRNVMMQYGLMNSKLRAALETMPNAFRVPLSIFSSMVTEMPNMRSGHRRLFSWGDKIAFWLNHLIQRPIDMLDLIADFDYLWTQGMEGSEILIDGDELSAILINIGFWTDQEANAATLAAGGNVRDAMFNHRHAKGMLQLLAAASIQVTTLLGKDKD